MKHGLTAEKLYENTPLALALVVSHCYEVQMLLCLQKLWDESFGLLDRY